MVTPDAAAAAERGMKQDAPTQESNARPVQTSPPAETKPVIRTFETRGLKNEVGTGKNVGYKDKEAGKETVTISKETEDQYVYFLKDYLNTFSDAIKLNPSLGDSKAAEVGRKLMDILTTDGKPDPAKISQFLNSKEGWIVTTEAMNEYALQLNSVLGFVTDTRPPSERGEQLKQEKVKIEGSRWFGRMVGFENPFGAKFIHFNQRADLFEALKNDPEQKAYIKGVLSIDLDDYRTNPALPDTVEKDPTRVSSSNRSPESLRRNILQIMQARRGFLRDLGVPLKKIDSLPEEALFTHRVLTEGFGETGLKWEKEIIDAFKPNEGGYVDGDIAGNIIRFNKARREVMLRYVSEVMIKDALQNPDKIASVVAERLKTIDAKDAQGNNIEAARRTREASDTKNKLEAEKQQANNKKSGLTDVETKQQAIRTLERQLQNEYLLTITTDFATTVNAEVQRLNQELNGVIGGIPGLNADRDAVETGWLNTYQTTFNTELQRRTAALGARGTVNTQEVEEYAKKVADVQHKRRLDVLDKQIKERKDRIEKLNTIKSNYDTAQKNFVEAETKLLTDIPKDLVVTQTTYDNLVTAAGATITPTELENRTIDQLILLATNPPHNIPNNTTEEKAALRLMLLRAKTEHRSMQIEQYDQSPQVQRDTLQMILTAPGATINLDNLLTMPEQQLRHLLSQPPYNWNNLQIESSLPLAQREATRKLIIRYKVSLEERIKDFDQQIQAQDEIIKNAGNLEKVKEALEMTNTILENQGEIFGRAIEIPREVNRYTDPNTVQNTDTEYSQAEREKALPKAYYEMLNVLFDYQHGGKIGEQALTREEYFKRIYSFLPPDKLLNLMWKSGIPGPFNFNNLNPDNFTSNTDLLITFRKIMNDLGKEAIAL